MPVLIQSQQKQKERIHQAAKLLKQASRPIRVLSSIAWPLSVKADFFNSGCSKLPEVSYPRFDPEPVRGILESARKQFTSDSVIDDWLNRQADHLEVASAMLAATGSADFYKHSRSLYGAPADPLIDGNTSSLGLSERFNRILKQLVQIDLGEPDPACILASHVAETMEQAVQEMFGAQAPKVMVVDDLSANALAGSKRIRIRRQACFTDRDVKQLINHEAYVHVATALNGRTQNQLPILSSSHPGTTRTQEGLAVFAEFISGTMALDRLRRLSDRTLAIQMAIDGADFIDVYRYFLEKTDQPDQSFESSRRVFRGGLITGRAPFTKDIVYLDGLLRVHNFLRTAVASNRLDCLKLLFCGKLDLEDIPALCELQQMGMLEMPRYLPPWASDLRFLLSYLAYSGFLNTIDLEKVSQHYEVMFQNQV